RIFRSIALSGVGSIIRLHCSHARSKVAKASVFEHEFATQALGIRTIFSMIRARAKGAVMSARSTALKTIDTAAATSADAEVACLEALQRKILWLSSWMIHNANHLRPNPDGVKVGGHQASSASVSTLMTALYLSVLKPEDRVAVKPHASPIFHSIQYLLGKQTRENLENFRALGGAQSYPSRTKDVDDVDFSTGSVGLGVAQTVFASMVQDYVRARRGD